MSQEHIHSSTHFCMQCGMNMDGNPTPSLTKLKERVTRRNGLVCNRCGQGNLTYAKYCKNCGQHLVVGKVL